jgi:hypothetical protein
MLITGLQTAIDFAIQQDRVVMFQIAQDFMADMYGKTVL